ncbi:MAG: glycosyltransferase family 4 protein [Planctomycetota bacterium]|jgi:glycosyltransferase involved in cell wall biosynthesis|nr:MAG: glycosyltransferase family 1 protein [Planctomycetaceae bacterium]
MRIVHITAGAGGRLCGSCLHDNALVRSLRQAGRDAILVSAYVPTTTDEENVSESKVVLGGINVWLQQYIPLFRKTPAFLDRLFDLPVLVSWLSARTGNARPVDLGAITISSLKGEQGYQRKEVEKLATWLKEEIQPDVIHLSNVLLVGLAERLKEVTGAGIVTSLSGEDLFIEQLPRTDYELVRKLLRERSAHVDRFVALNEYFANFMSEYLSVSRSCIDVVHHGVDREGFSEHAPDLMARRESRPGTVVIGYLARVCQEKGLLQLIRAVSDVASRPGCGTIKLLAAGAEIPAENPYLQRCLQTANSCGLGDRFEWLGQIDRKRKIELLHSIDLFALPTQYAESKGISAIEALVAGVPVVAPKHGAFPELLDHGQAGLLHTPHDEKDLANTIFTLVADAQLSQLLGAHGHALASRRNSPLAMVSGHDAIYSQVCRRT